MPLDLQIYDLNVLLTNKLKHILEMAEIHTQDVCFINKWKRKKVKNSLKSSFSKYLKLASSHRVAWRHYRFYDFYLYILSVLSRLELQDWNTETFSSFTYPLYQKRNDKLLLFHFN